MVQYLSPPAGVTASTSARRAANHALAPGPASVFAALGDPTRSAIVSLLAEADRSVTALAEEFPISLQGTMKHITVLERAGLVKRSKRGRTVTVRLRRDVLEDAELWLRRNRLFWTNQLDRLASHFEEQP
jgi:DNA-binding transcriptional ArsR family regulator